MRRNWHDRFVCRTVGSTIDVEAGQDVEQFINAFTQGEEPKPTSMNQDWNAIPREGAASQSCNQPEVTSPAPNSVPPGKFLQESTSPYFAGEPGKRTRGPAKTKCFAVKERDEFLLLDLSRVHGESCRRRLRGPLAFHRHQLKHHTKREPNQSWISDRWN